MNTLQITVNSAWDTLQIIDRQSRKDVSKLIEFGYSAYLAATSPEAIVLYRTIIDITCHPWQSRETLSDGLKLYQAGVRAIALVGMLAMFAWSLFREWSDRLVDNCLEKPVAEDAPVVEDAEVIAPSVPPAKEKKDRKLSLKPNQRYIKTQTGGVIVWSDRHQSTVTR